MLTHPLDVFCDFLSYFIRFMWFLPKFASWPSSAKHRVPFELWGISCE